MKRAQSLMSALRIILIAILLVAWTGSTVSAQDFANSDEDVCYNAAVTTSFALYSRVNGVSEANVRALTTVKFPVAEWPESARLAGRVIDQVYSLSLPRLETFKPVDRDAMEGIEAGTFIRCMEEWR
jgi:hypothetical protein